MSTKKKTRKKSSKFEGDMAEGLSDLWQWLNLSKKQVLDLVKQIAQRGWLLSGTKAEMAASDKIFQVYPRWPVDMRFLLTTQLSPAQDGRSVSSFCLFMLGYPNIVTIQETYAWKDGVEGYVNADIEDGPSIDFLVPLFDREKDAYTPRIATTVYLSALAFNLQPAEEYSYKISEGPVYELLLAQFLQENPDATKKDFPYVDASTHGLTSLLPTENTSFYYYRSKILHVFPMDAFAQTDMVKLNVLLIDLASANSLKVNLYAKKSDLNGYKPKEGDFIEGILWLFGSTHYMTGAVPTSDDYTE